MGRFTRDQRIAKLYWEFTDPRDGEKKWLRLHYTHDFNGYEDALKELISRLTSVHFKNEDKFFLQFNKNHPTDVTDAVKTHLKKRMKLCPHCSQRWIYKQFEMCEECFIAMKETRQSKRLTREERNP